MALSDLDTTPASMTQASSGLSATAELFVVYCMAHVHLDRTGRHVEDN